jgi:uncharacterized protein (DUF1330 family)
MSAYFVIELDVADGPKLAEYEREATQHVLAAGGRFIVRGANYKTIEGDWRPKRLVIVEFPSIEAIERYYHSEPNQRLKRTRVAGTGGAPARAIAIEGLVSAADAASDRSKLSVEAGVDASGTVIWN